MNKNYITLDIETIPNPILPDWFKEYINIRIEKKRGDNKDVNKYCQVSCPEAGQIFCIVLGINGTEFILLKGTEYDILCSFWKYMKEFLGYRIVGFNSKNFDILYIKKRSCILGVETFNIDIPTRKYEKFHHYDILEVLSNFGTSESHTLEAYCKMYNVPYDNIDDGNKILSLYQAGKYDEIYTKCLNDVKATDKLYNKIYVYL